MEILNLKGEIWKEYMLPKESTSKYFRLFFSNFGRAKSMNRFCKNGRILRGSLREGYPIISLKLYKERAKNIQKKVDDYSLTISLLLEEIRDLKKIYDIPKEIIDARLESLSAKKEETVQLRKNYIQKTEKKRITNVHILVHRGVAELFLEKNNENDVVIHKDFVKTNNHLDNLEWATKTESFDRYKINPYYLTGKYKEQFANPNRKHFANCKLTVEDVLYIKEKLTQGKTLKELAKKFGVSDMQIHRIKTGENWKNVKTVKELKELDDRNEKWQAT